MIALRADLSGNPTAREFLARVREVALEAFENQEVPLEILIPALGSRRDASRSPLFQVMFVLQNNPMPAVRPLDLAFSPLNIDQGTGTSKFDLSLGFEDTPEGFTGSVEFNTDLFKAATIERFSRQYVKAIEFLVAHPEQPAFGTVAAHRRGARSGRGVESRRPRTSPFSLRRQASTARSRHRSVQHLTVWPWSPARKG